MKRTLECALCAVLLAVGNAGADDVIAVNNAGFETPGPFNGATGWTFDAESKIGSMRIGWDDLTARQGKSSLTMTNSEFGSAVVLSDPVKLRVGHLYRVSGWIRTSGLRSDPTTRYPTAVPACLTMESFPFTNHSVAVGGDADWTRVETLFIATRSTDRVRLHYGHNGTAMGRVWFDDIQLEKVEDIASFIPMETVRWFGNGYRYDDRGWIFVHIEGEPYERGFQYGALLADEIVQYMSKLAVRRNESDPADGWKNLRFEADALFMRGYDEEYLTEMKGIADGAAHAGGKYGDRAVDLIDIVTINSAIDLGQLRRALSVTPHALTGESFLEAREEMCIAHEDHKCSAFAATGPATATGDIVFGQIFMWSGYTGVHWNVITDIEPTAGHRLVYHTFPGGIHSGADFYINAAGIVIGETTVSQTPFEPDSTPQSNRIRKAAQYASTIEDVERILWEGNNGMYTNDWPIADVKTGEAAILLLGTHRKKLWRTSEDMSPFGTPGFLWANNNNRDPEVRKEYLAQPDDRPYDLVFSPWNRDVAFNQFYERYKGKLDSTAAVRMWASSPINRAHACDGKITTTEMARELAFLAHYGKVTLREKFPQKGYRIMPDLPDAVPHLSLGYAVASPIFVTDQLKAARDAGRWQEPAEPQDATLEFGDLAEAWDMDKAALWRRTVYPASPAENWFVSASAAYWRLLEPLSSDKTKKPAEHLSNELASLNRRFLYTVARESDMPAVSVERAYDRYGPYQVPRIKGTFALHQLRLRLGNADFLSLMRSIHERYAGQSMTNAQCLALIQEMAGPEGREIIEQWIQRSGLPQLKLKADSQAAGDDTWNVVLTIEQAGQPYRLATHVVVDTGNTQHVRLVQFDAAEHTVTLNVPGKPTRVAFNALNDIPVENPNYYTWSNFIDDFHDTLIVYATARQDEANHTLARRWQETVANAYVEILPPLVKDSELTAADAAKHDLIVMGTLGDNRWLQQAELHVPVRFGRNHFEWQGQVYGEPDDGLFLVVPNPWNPARVMYVVAGNSALQLHQMTRAYDRNIPSWALYKDRKIVEQGYHEPADFLFVLDLADDSQQADSR